MSNLPRQGGSLDNFEHLDDFHPEAIVLKRRLISIHGEINLETACDICSQLLVLEALDRNADITIHLDSYYGNFVACLAIHDIIRMVSCKVTTVCLGDCVGGNPVLIFLAGDLRLMAPHGRLGLGHPKVLTQGKHLDVKVKVEELLKDKQTTLNLITRYTGIPTEQAEMYWKEDVYFDAKTAVQLKFADNITQTRKTQENKSLMVS